MTITVSAKGQMVIPAVIRNRYGIAPNTKVELLDLGNEVVIVPLPKNPLSESRGILKGVSSDDLIKERRGQRKKEHPKL